MAKTRYTEKLDAEGAAITSEALPFEEAEDLLPEVADVVGTALEFLGPKIASGEIQMTMDAMKLAPVLSLLAKKLGSGRLKALAPRIMAGTQVLLDDNGEKDKCDLVTKTDRARCFDARPDLYLPILFHAGKVTFARFFPAAWRGGSRRQSTSKAE